MRNIVMTAFMTAGLLMSCNSQNKVVVNGEKVDLEDGIYAKLETNKGDILFQFETEKAPMTSANFIALAEGNMPGVKEEYKGKPYFDGVTFHRVVPGFMIQGGDPDGTGLGGPGYEFPNETSNDLTHNKGVVSMANAGPGTNGSQFFITVAPTTQLDGGYSIFGKVIKGQKVADAISEVERDGRDKPKEAVTINKMTIIRKGKKAQKFDAPKVFKDEQDNLASAQAEQEKEALAEIEKMAEGFDKTPSGLRIKITEEGEGDKNPQQGENVSVHYTGMFVDGEKFQSSVDSGEPITFRLGVGQVIKGWDEGIGMMHVGDKARLIIPPDLAYGPQGRGTIPGNSWLVFDVELVDIKGE